MVGCLVDSRLGRTVRHWIRIGTANDFITVILPIKVLSLYCQELNNMKMTTYLVNDQETAVQPPEKKQKNSQIYRSPKGIQ